MKRIIFIFSIFLTFSFSVNAVNSSVKKANDLYAKGDYQAAANAYEQILLTDGVAPELYFNLGNAYYKSGEVGRSILNYERALRLNPTYDDAKANLEMAQLKVVDNVVQIPPFFIKRWVSIMMKLLTSDEWLAISVVSLVLTLSAILFFIFGYSLTNRKISFYLAVILLCFTVLTGFFSGVRKYQMTNHTDAIIMSGAVNVKSSPDKSGTDLFQLHEGTKVSIKSSLGKWTEIVLGNGSVGWVEDENIIKI